MNRDHLLTGFRENMQQDTQQKTISRKAGSLDFYLILATVGVLFALSVICVFSMFYFKFAAVQLMPPADKLAYLERMNTVVVPFIIGLILLLGICVPKRLMPVRWMNRFALALAIAATVVSVWQGIKTGLIVVLVASLILQLVVLVLAVAGSKHLHFEKSGYWVRVGSSLVHLGLILFVLDLLLYKHLALHLFLFWVTTGASVLGMLLCFYSQGVASVAQKIRQR